MPETGDLLIEIGTEELPPLALRRMSESLGKELSERLQRQGLDHEKPQVYATPRRLAVVISGLAITREDREIERRGPMVEAAFDSEGKPTKAALGFAKSCGVEVEHLEQVDANKNGGASQLMFRSTEVGESTASTLPALVTESISRIPVPRRMRWGAGSAEFSRPIHWIVLLFNDELVETEILGITTTRMTQGHRFHKPEGIRIDSAAEYASTLYSNGFVMAEFDARREMIRTQTTETAESLGGTAVIDPLLLEEITALVEWPVAVSGRFDDAFLNLPDAVLMATMKGHQKYFPVKGADGALLPHFIAISNIDSKRPESVSEGNERVLRPRLADAQFFFDADKKLALEDLQTQLQQVVFQNKLGSMADKTARVSKLAGMVAIAMGLDPDAVKQARRAGNLSKCDLLTQLVREMPQLQGVLGREYALKAGEPGAVADALAEAYLPKYAGDDIPLTPLGKTLAIADKLDTLIGIFGIGQKPTGEKDPFALRRAALGVMRILIEGEMTLNLHKLLEAAVAGYEGQLENDQVGTEVFDFMIERLQGYFTDQGIATEVIAAVQALKPREPLDFANRVQAVHRFYQLDEAASLAAANKRIRNILRKVSGDLPSNVNDELFKENAEWDLAAKLVGLTPRVQELLKNRDYSGALGLLAGLRETVDTFFDQVKVMDDDEQIKNNRLALLNNISELFLATADISRLQA